MIHRLDKMTEEAGGNRLLEEDCILVSLDPGPTATGVCCFDGFYKLLACGHLPNDSVERLIERVDPCITVCEDIVGFGMSVGKSTFDTAKQIGRFWILSELYSREWHLINRRDIKLLCCGDAKAKDKDIRAAMIASWGQQGTAKLPGPTYGFTNHTWSALAVGTAWIKQRRDKRVRDAMKLEGGIDA